MENYKKSEEKDRKDRDIVFSKAIKAGKRVYYIDVKKNRKEDFFLAITESKRIKREDSVGSPFEFEKHKIFLYKEDFEKFTDGLEEALSYIRTCTSQDLDHEWVDTSETEAELSLDDEISFEVEDF